MGIPIVDVSTPSDYGELRNIRFRTELDTTKKWQEYHCQNIMTFDIETSSGYRTNDGVALQYDYDAHEEYSDLEPMSIMYVWQFAIETQDGVKVFMGRTWEEFETFMELLNDEIMWSAVNPGCSINSRYREIEMETAKTIKPTVHAYIYIHNFGFEYQHLRNIWEKELSYSRNTKNGKSYSTFARTARKPMKSSFRYNRVKLNFKDSLTLTQKSLSNWCKDENLAIKKLEEPADYYIPIRTPITVLTQDEIMYSINDVVSMVYGLEIYRNKYGTMQNIPLTQTGQVRRICVEKVTNVNRDWAKHCTNLMKNYDLEMFNRLMDVFSGGWTHANATYVGRKMKGVTGMDFASSYPAVMATKTFPIGEFEEVPTTMFDELVDQDLHDKDLDYHYMMTMKIYDVVTKTQNTLWSISKVKEIKGQLVDNGRIVYADEMEISLTDLDWDTFKQAYEFSSYEVKELHRSKSGFLATELIETILDYYEDKTKLKGTTESSKYNESKQFVNSIYGVAVTKIASDEIVFDEGWEKIPLDDEMFYSIMQATSEDRTFLAYQHGVWITAWARHNLWRAILQMDKRTVYCDTDSIKGVFNEEDFEWFAQYNAEIELEQIEVARRLEIDVARYAPTDPKGNPKRLGIFEPDGYAVEFKTLGAKRYCSMDEDGKIDITVAGLPKSAGPKRIQSVDDFHNGVTWDSKDSGKLIAYYNDDQKPTLWIDRDGNEYVSNDKFGIALKPTTFDLSISDEFMEFLEMVLVGKTPDDMVDIPAIFR